MPSMIWMPCVPGGSELGPHYEREAGLGAVMHTWTDKRAIRGSGVWASGVSSFRTKVRIRASILRVARDGLRGISAIWRHTVKLASFR